MNMKIDLAIGSNVSSKSYLYDIAINMKRKPRPVINNAVKQEKESEIDLKDRSGNLVHGSSCKAKSHKNKNEQFK